MIARGWACWRRWRDGHRTCHGSEEARELERLLSPREQARIGYVLGQKVIEQERIDQGEALLEDL